MSDKKTYIYEVSRSLPEITKWYIESEVSLTGDELIDLAKRRENDAGDLEYGMANNINGCVFVGWGARGIFEHDAVAWRIDKVEEVIHEEDEDE